MSSPVRYGSGPGSDPHEGPGGRQEVPFGPEISWPYGFRPMDTGSREELESAYGTGPGYQQPAVDDYGYGDPGYADPSYEGPRAPHGGSALAARRLAVRRSAARTAVPGTPRRRGLAGDPATGHPTRRSRVPRARGPRFRTARVRKPRLPAAGLCSAIRRPGDLAGDRRPGGPPDNGPQPPACTWYYGARGSGGSPQAASPAYPDQWYDNPRLNDRVLDDVPRDQPRPGGSWLDGPRPDGPSAGSRPVDPRLAGMNYGELRYDEPAPGQPGYDEPLDDESWYEELRRSGPAYPKGFGPQHPSGPQRRVEPQAPGYSQQPGFPQRRIGRPGTTSPAATGEAHSRRYRRALR